MKGGIFMKKLALLIVMTLTLVVVSTSFIWAADVDPYRVVNPPQISVPK